MLGRVTIVGCGLIGGSIVKGLRARGAAKSVCAVDRADVLALAAPLLDESAAAGTREARSVVAKSDLVILAAPVAAILESLNWVLDAIGPRGVVTDTGSVKMPILAAVEAHSRASRFVAGHPMAGRETGGFEVSSPTLFEGAKWFLVSEPAEGIRSDRDAMEQVSALVVALGASTRAIDGRAHDRAMAYVSHVPHLISSAVYDAAARAGVVGEAGPGFRDVTRIAGAPPLIWRDIFEANRDQIAAALGQVLEPLVGLWNQLRAGDKAAVLSAVELLERAGRAKSTGTPNGQRGGGER
jgi:prephenate dehydrogenase